MITFDFPPLTSEMAAWNDSHKSTVSDVWARVSTASVVALGWGRIDMWGARERRKPLRLTHKKNHTGRNKKLRAVCFKSATAKYSSFFSSTESKWNGLTYSDNDRQKGRETPWQLDKEKNTPSIKEKETNKSTKIRSTCCHKRSTVNMKLCVSFEHLRPPWLILLCQYWACLKGENKKQKFHLFEPQLSVGLNELVVLYSKGNNK